MGTLFVVSTPIGNLDDITVRAIKTLFSVHAIACEDTRRTGILLQELRKRYSSFFAIPNTSPNLISFHGHNEREKIPEIISLLKQEKSIALVSDAGTPAVSDPGFSLVREVISRDIKVEAIPGPNAALAALVSSGLPTDTFLFLGYLPEKSSHRRKTLLSLKGQLDRLENRPTVILFASPHKMSSNLTEILGVFGNIEIVIARELTKVYEEIWRSTIDRAITHFNSPKGEFVILF